METTLKGLHRVEIDLARVISELISKTAGKMNLTLGAYDSNLKAAVEKQRLEFTEGMEDALKLNVLRFNVRRVIQEKSQQAGINTLLNGLARTQSAIKVLTDLLSTARGYGDSEATLEDSTLQSIETKFQSVRDNPGAAVARSDAVSISCVFTQAQLDGFRSNSVKLRHEVENAKDAIGTLNVSTKVNVPFTSDDVALLKKYNVYGVDGSRLPV